MRMRSRSALTAFCVVMLVSGGALGVVLAQAGGEPGHRHQGPTLQNTEIRSGALSPQASAFLRENDAAMGKMMAAMEVKPTDDIDRDFVAMMVPHHQGAIDMAQAVLRYSHNPQIRRLAQEIIVTQQQEIAAMRLAVGDPLPASTAVPTQITPAQ